jgi:hypothetical protein
MNAEPHLRTPRRFTKVRIANTTRQCGCRKWIAETRAPILAGNCNCDIQSVINQERQYWLQPTIPDDQEPNPEPPWRLLMGLRGLFGLIFRSLRLHRKNLTGRGVDANLFSIFRSWFGDVDGPETRAVPSSALRILPPGALVNAIRPAWAFVIVSERFPSFCRLLCRTRW